MNKRPMGEVILTGQPMTETCACAHPPTRHLNVKGDCLANTGRNFLGKVVFCGCKAYEAQSGLPGRSPDGKEDIGQHISNEIRNA